MTEDGPGIDLNADLGESFGRWQLGDDAAMLDLITSANVATGFHAGDPTTLRRVCRRAVAEHVVIGAQVGYRDLAGFGRRFLDIAAEDLTAEIIYQVGALDALAASTGQTVAYLKPHGALYNAVVDHAEQAHAIVQALQALPRPLPVLGLPGSLLLRIAADQGLPTVTEYFVDRAYTDDGRLVDRREPGAVLTDPDVAAERAVDAAQNGVADSFCLHGDSPSAVQMGTTVRAALQDAGVTIRPFTTR